MTLLEIVQLRTPPSRRMPVTWYFAVLCSWARMLLSIVMPDDEVTSIPVAPPDVPARSVPSRMTLPLIVLALPPILIPTGQRRMRLLEIVAADRIVIPQSDALLMMFPRMIVPLTPVFT